MNTPLIQSAELRDQLSTTLVFDVRHQLSDPDWGRRSHVAARIPGARFLHMDEDLCGPRTGRNGRHPLPDPAVFAERLASLGMHDGAQVVVYDQNNGTMAARLWWMLAHWLGHPSVRLLDGGWDAWVVADLPTQPETPRHGSAVFAARPRAQASVDADWLQAHLHDGHMLVVDARAAERYAGWTEPLDPVAGHIPGALNRPCSHNLASDGRFKSPASLRAEWGNVLGERPAEQVVHQCGSGITACHNLLAMEVAGFTGMRLYPGSWSEWCSDSQRPVAHQPPAGPAACTA